MKDHDGIIIGLPELSGFGRASAGLRLVLDKRAADGLELRPVRRREVAFEQEAQSARELAGGRFVTSLGEQLPADGVGGFLAADPDQETVPESIEIP